MKLTFLTKYFLDSLLFKIPVPFYYISKVPILRSELCTLESSRLAQIFPIYRQYFPSATLCVGAGGGGPGLGGAGPVRDQARRLLRHAQSGDQVGQSEPATAVT